MSLAAIGRSHRKKRSRWLAGCLSRKSPSMLRCTSGASRRKRARRARAKMAVMHPQPIMVVRRWSRSSILQHRRRRRRCRLSWCSKKWTLHRTHHRRRLRERACRFLDRLLRSLHPNAGLAILTRLKTSTVALSPRPRWRHGEETARIFFLLHSSTDYRSDSRGLG